MTRKFNKTCIVCGEKYSYCNSCKEHTIYPTWMNIFHNENCKNVFNTASAYLAGTITKEEAKTRFDACDMSYKENLKSDIVNAINEACKSEEKNNIEIKVEVDHAILEPVEYIEPEVEVEVAVEEKKFFKKKVVFE